MSLAKCFVVVAAGFVASTALAESKNSNNEKVNQSATAPAIPGVPAATATKASVSAPVAQGATSTASLPATTAKQTRKVKFGFTTVQSVAKTSFDSGNYVPSTENLASVTYALSATQSVSLRQGFTYSYPQNGKPGAAKMADTAIQFVDANVAELPGGWGVTGLGRVALPTGEGSRFTHRRKGYLMGLGSVAKTIGRTDVSFSLVGIYFNSPDASYMAGGKAQPNPSYELDQEVSVGYNLTDTLSIYQLVGTSNVFMRSSASHKVERDQSLGLETGVTYDLKPIRITGAVSNGVNIWNNPKPFALYNDDDMMYTLTLAASL